MTRGMTFKDYFHWYVGSAAILSAIMALIVVTIGALLYADLVRDPKIKERAFYLALEGQKTSNPQADLAAMLVKHMVKLEKLGKSGLLKLRALIKIDNGLFYHEIYLEKNQAIDELIGGKKINLSHTVEVPGWWIFWKWSLLIAWAWLAIWMTGGLLLKSLDRSESILEWPWHRVWTYPAILFMSPALLPTMLIESGYRIAKRTLWQTVTGRRPEAQREQAAASPVDTANDKWLEEKKIEALKAIAAAKEKTDESKQRWVDYCLRRADRTARFESEIESLRNHLSGLGQSIAQTQRDLAEKQKVFEAYKKEIKVDHGRDKYRKAFEQIAALAHVEAVELNSYHLYVFTDTLFIIHEARRYEIGKFRITIDLNYGQVNETRNLCSTHPANDHHPYGRGGLICFGAMRNRIDHALSQNEVALAVQYILLSLQSAEGDNPGRVREWKEVRDE